MLPLLAVQVSLLPFQATVNKSHEFNFKMLMNQIYKLKHCLSDSLSQAWYLTYIDLIVSCINRFIWIEFYFKIIIKHTIFNHDFYCPSSLDRRQNNWIRTWYESFMYHAISRWCIFGLVFTLKWNNGTQLYWW